MPSVVVVVVLLPNMVLTPTTVPGWGWTCWVSARCGMVGIGMLCGMECHTSIAIPTTTSAETHRSVRWVEYCMLTGYTISMVPNHAWWPVNIQYSDPSVTTVRSTTV